MAGGNMYILHRHMNVEIRTEAALFPEKEYIMGISFAEYNCVTYFLALFEKSDDIQGQNAL
jgi:hypothetical protein